MREAKALTRLGVCTGSSEPYLLANAINTKNLVRRPIRISKRQNGLESTANTQHFQVKCVFVYTHIMMKHFLFIRQHGRAININAIWKQNRVHSDSIKK